MWLDGRASVQPSEQERGRLVFNDKLSKTPLGCLALVVWV